MLKRLIFLSVLTLFVLAWGLPALADELAADQAENIVPSAGAKTPGDILWHCDVQTLPPDNLCLGVETFRDTIYITGGGNLPHSNPNQVHVWLEQSGLCTYLYSVNQPTLADDWGWRDIACDGQYLYASNSYVLTAFTVAPAGVTTYPGASITVNSGQMPSLNPVRAVAYDEDNDWFWAANFSNPIYAFDRAGNMMATYANTAGPAYGMAYDNTTPHGPFLWVHVQDSTNVYQFHIPTGVFTGVVYSGWGDDDPGVSGIAGGLCVLEGDPSKGKGNVTLLGITQCDPVDEMYAMEICKEESLYWKPGYENYAPSGMPDIDMWQGFGWFKTETGRPTFDGPCAVANCFKWFDSKYEEGFGGFPGDGFDQFPLVRDYLDNLPTFLPVPDDHSPENVDNDWVIGIPFTPWNQGATTPPPATTQPFIPGYQTPPQPMPAWGELVERLAWYLDLDGVQSGYCNHSGTRPQDMYDGIVDWLESETFAGGTQWQFVRGDINQNGAVDLGDLTACFEGPPFSCDDAADANDDGILDGNDCQYLEDFLFVGGPAPPEPYPNCGLDPTPDQLGCDIHTYCPSAKTLADTLCVNLHQKPTFALVESLVEKCEDVILLLGFWFYESPGGPDLPFIRGDLNGDGVLNVGDWVMCNNGPPFACWDAADVNDDGEWGQADIDYLWAYCMEGGPPPPPPYPGCGEDPTYDDMGCFDHDFCGHKPSGNRGAWLRCGGHWVTVAGINSEDYLIGISDPVTDNAEWGGRGRVGDGWILEHNHELYDHGTHNDEGNVSHDIYDVIVDPISPGGLWELVDYGAPSVSPSFLCDRFEGVNVPPEFEPMTAPWNFESPLVVEVEYAIQVSPWDYRGDVNIPNGDGVVTIDDVVFLLNFLFKGGLPPLPMLEGDVTCDGIVTIDDVVFLLNYLFKNGPVPRCCDP